MGDTTTTTLGEGARAAAESALRGLWAGGPRDPVAAAHRALLGVGDAPARAWMLALEACGWSRTPDRTPPVEAADLAALVGQAGTERPLAFAAMELALVAFAHADRVRLAGARDVVEGLGTHVPPDADVARRLVALLAAALDGAWRDVVDAAAPLADAATQADLPYVALAARSTGAFAALSAGDVDAGRALARRASRESREARLPQQEYFANLVLARARRLSGNPHLATRILTALARHAPLTWRPALTWELILAGSDRSALGALETLPAWSSQAPMTRAAKRLMAVLVAAEELPTKEFDAAAVAVRDAVREVPWLAADAELTLAAVDYRAGVKFKRNPALEDWLTGRTHDTPAALTGLVVKERLGDTRDTNGVAVVAAPGMPTRRILARGIGLAARTLGATPKTSPDRTQERREVATAELAFAGDAGLSEAEFFRRVYALTFDKGTHRNMVDALVHRIRETVGDDAELVRDKQHFALHVRRPVVLPDPRCAEPLAQRVLRVVAERAGASAKDIAEVLDVPLRTVQASLRELANEGAFELDVEGRKHSYRVVDTTFTEPTNH